MGSKAYEKSQSHNLLKTTGGKVNETSEREEEYVGMDGIQKKKDVEGESIRDLQRTKRSV